MLENSGHLVNEMQRRYRRLNAVRSNPLSNTIYFRHPGDEVVRKYSLATMEIEREGRREKHAHVVVMPHVTLDVIGEFLSDLQSFRSNS
jgi:histidine decarboxylase